MVLHVMDMEQRSEEWYAARCGLVTASTIKTLVTPATLKTASNDGSRGLTAQLLAERITGWSETTYQSADMFRGVVEEPRAIEVYAKLYQRSVETVGFMVRDDWGFSIGYSPDGLVGDDGLIEVKAPRSKGHVQTIVAGVVPAEHMAQLQCGLLVSGRAWVDYVSFCGGLPLWTKRVEPNPEWHTAILAAVAAFEKTVAAWLATYEKATEGLAQTERALEMEMVI